MRRIPPHWLLAILIFGGSLWHYRPAYDPAAHFNDKLGEVMHVARSFAREGRLANPFKSLPTGTSAMVSPVYPVLAGGLLRIFGEGPQGIYACQWLAALAVALELALLPVLGSAIGTGALAGAAAALLWLLAGAPAYPYWEATLAGAIAVLATWQFARCLEHPSPLSLVWLGGLIGLLVLTEPPALPVVAACLLAAALGPWRHTPWRIAAVGALAVLVCLPWLIRNYMVFHEPVFLRDFFGVELAVSNNPCAQASFDENWDNGCFEQYHPNTNPAEARAVATLGEVRYSHQKLAQATAWIAAHPGRFAALSARRAELFWFPSDTGSPLGALLDPGHRRERAIEYALTLLSLAGLLLLARRHPWGALLAASWLLLYPAAYYFVQYEDRYRAPMLWVTFLLGAYALTAAARILRRPRPARISRAA